MYLYLSAILAVPLLSEDTGKAAPLPPEELRGTLERMVPPRFGDSYIEPPGPSNLETLTNLLPEDGNAAFKDTNINLKYLANRASDIDNQVQRVRQVYDHFTGIVKTNVGSHLSNAVDAYRLEVSVRFGYREASQHFLSLRNWFQLIIRDAIEAVEGCDRSY